MSERADRVRVDREWGGPVLRGCPVCGIGADGKPTAYHCTRTDCPTHVTAFAGRPA